MPVSLHTHSWYSLLEGASSPELLVKAAIAGRYSALALTDTNNLYGAVAFVDLATRFGLRPLLGACLKHQGQRAVALIADRAGYRSLCRVISRLNLAEDADLALLLCTCAEGLHVLVDDVSLAERLREAFGPRLWLEVIRPRDPRHEETLLQAGRRLGLRPVASLAAHFVDPREYRALRLITAVRRNDLLERMPATLTVSPEHRLVGVEEMRRRFRDLPRALTNSDALAELLRSDVLPRDLILPRPHLTRDLDLIAYLHALCERGLRERDLGGDLAARDRLRKELAIIESADLAGYFLTVRDIARLARKRGHTMALRGSAGNSLVCYLLGITDVDPLRFELELERFLHPGRVDLPDIDLDFDWKVRDELIDSVIKRYGQTHVARISSHLFFQPRSAFRAAAKTHGLSNEQVSELLLRLDERVDAILLPDEEDRKPPSERVLGTALTDPVAFVADARRLLGRPTHLSLHPGGIVITSHPVEDHAPLQMAAKGLIMTQYEKDAVERLGLVKIDLLGNRALSTVDDARLLARTYIPSPIRSGHDPATVQLLQRGDTVGITQMESPAMRHLLLQTKPTRIDDVIQSLALLRPGAASIGMKERFIRRRHGLEPVAVAHPALEVILGQTHGLMLYEDDALRLIQGLTGLPAADADRFRKRISKHRTDEEAEALRREFFALCSRQKISPEGLNELWQQMAKFNRYSFCKSHSVSYGLIAWQAAYLKAHYPLPFWVAALNNNMGAYARWVYMEEIKRCGFEVKRPCVNQSQLIFALEKNTIRTGLDVIAGLPQQVKADIIRERHRDGPYLDLADLRRRVNLGPESLAVLIRSGTLDFTGRTHPALLLEADLAQPRTGNELFASDPLNGWVPPDDPPSRRHRDEWELLGFVTGPSLFSLFRRPLPPRGPVIASSTRLREHAGRRVRVQGLVATGRHVLTEDGRPIQFVTLEDGEGLVEVTLFGDCPQVPYLTIGPYLATGVVENRHGALTVTAQRFESLADQAATPCR